MADHGTVVVTMVGTSDTLALAGPGHLPEEHDSDCCQLFKLDDACLLNVMRFLEPLPDLFALQRSCWVSLA